MSGTQGLPLSSRVSCVSTCSCFALRRSHVRIAACRPARTFSLLASFRQNESSAAEAKWVETKCGVPDHDPEKPEQSCTVCNGQGKVTCGTCGGVGALLLSLSLVLVAEVFMSPDSTQAGPMLQTDECCPKAFGRCGAQAVEAAAYGIVRGMRSAWGNQC